MHIENFFVIDNSDLQSLVYEHLESLVKNADSVGTMASLIKNSDAFVQIFKQRKGFAAILDPIIKKLVSHESLSVVELVHVFTLCSNSPLEWPLSAVQLLLTRREVRPFFLILILELS